MKWNNVFELSILALMAWLVVKAWRQERAWDRRQKRLGRSFERNRDE